jgi:hypothetical protein
MRRSIGRSAIAGSGRDEIDDPSEITCQVCRKAALQWRRGAEADRGGEELYSPLLQVLDAGYPLCGFTMDTPASMRWRKSATKRLRKQWKPKPGHYVGGPSAVSEKLWRLNVPLKKLILAADTTPERMRFEMGTLF